MRHIRIKLPPPRATKSESGPTFVTYSDLTDEGAELSLVDDAGVAHDLFDCVGNVKVELVPGSVPMVTLEVFGAELDLVLDTEVATFVREDEALDAQRLRDLEALVRKIGRTLHENDGGGGIHPISVMGKDEFREIDGEAARLGLRDWLLGRIPSDEEVTREEERDRAYEEQKRKEFGG